MPPPSHLALAATLVIHPSHTTRTLSDEKHQAANQALALLKHVNQLVGPHNAAFSTAFQFTEASTSSRRKRAKTRQSDVSSNKSEEPDKLDCPLADEESLWSNAQDFWSVIGWAFNCSVAHKQRWERWRLWLDFMLGVLEDDLTEKAAHADQKRKASSQTAAEMTLAESLLVQYLAAVGEGRSGKRKVMRAILAEGSTKSQAEFGEIWRHETKPPKEKKETKLVRKRKLEIDEGEFGDYLDEDSDDDSNGTPIPRSRSAAKLPVSRLSRNGASDSENERDRESGIGDTNERTGIEAFGGVDSIHLRQRLLALLTKLCALYPPAFLDTEDLFDLYTEFLRPLPLTVFEQFISPWKPYLSTNTQASLNQMLLRPFLASVAPAYDENSLTQHDFEAHFGPFAANVSSIVENARVSLLVESLMRLLWKSGGLVANGTLAKVVKEGIAARKAKAGFDGRRKTDTRAKEEDEAWSVLERSGARMTVLLETMHAR